MNIAEKSKMLHFKARPAQICSTDWQRVNKDAPHVRATRYVLSLFFIIRFILSYNYFFDLKTQSGIQSSTFDLFAIIPSGSAVTDFEMIHAVNQSRLNDYSLSPSSAP